MKLDGETTEQASRSGLGDKMEYQCVHSDGVGGYYFNDGPSSPALVQYFSTCLGESLSNWRWNTLFWPAGVNHDYCYHHNGGTYGYTRETCDDQLYQDVSASCDQHDLSRISWFSKVGCRANAGMTLGIVRTLGRGSWDVMNTRVYYPDRVPLAQQTKGPPGFRDPDIGKKADETGAAIDAETCPVPDPNLGLDGAP